MHKKGVAGFLGAVMVVSNSNMTFANNFDNTNVNNNIQYKSSYKAQTPTWGIGTTTAGLNVRKGPSTSYTKLGYLGIGTKVEVIGKDSTTGWYKIKYNGNYGYISSQYVNMSSTNTGGGTDGSIDQVTVIKTGVTTATLNVRKGPSTSYISMGKIAVNTNVQIVEIKSTGWYKIKYNGSYGYVSGQYVKIGGTTGGNTNTGRVYQNPSQYFQIQDSISFAGQGGYTLVRGTMGLKVRKVQQKLGMETSNKAIVGPTTISKVKAFQTQKGLPQTGNVDYKTWKALGLSDYDWNYLGSYVSPIRITKNSTKQQCIEAMISRAYDYLGTEYIVGAAGQPGQGIDCSGLVMQSLYAVGISPLPSNVIRHSQPGYEYESANLFNSSKLKKVSYSERQRGDLIFYSNSQGTVIHVAIYLGNNQVIEAWPNKVVVWPIQNAYRSKIAGVRRVFN